MELVNCCTFHRKVAILCPSFCHAILDVEKAQCLGLEASRHDCCGKDVERTVDSARCGPLMHRPGSERGTTRAKLLRDSIVKEDEVVTWVMLREYG